MQKLNNRSVDVRVFRLVTGEECIVRVDSEDDVSITCSAAKIFMQNAATQAIEPAPVSMVAFTPENPNVEVKFFKTSIMAEIRDISDELYKKFVEGTSRIALD